MGPAAATRFSFSTASSSAGSSKTYIPSTAVQSRIEDYVFVATNEYGQENTQRTLTQVPLCGNTVIGCSGLFVLNVASLREGIEYIEIIDINENVCGFWVEIKKILSDVNVTLESAKWNILAYLEEDPVGGDMLLAEINNGLSFLSSEERFNRIRKIFQEGRFSFTLLDFTNTKKFGEYFADLRKQGKTPDTVYVSNVAINAVKADTLEPKGKMETYEKVMDSYRHIPKTCIVVDARQKVTGGTYDLYATQRVHQPRIPRRELLRPLCQDLLLSEIERDDAEGILACLKNGGDLELLEPRKGGETLLMKAVKEKKNHALFTIMQFLKEAAPDELDELINAVDDEGHTASYYAKKYNNLTALKLLKMWGAAMQ